MELVNSIKNLTTYIQRLLDKGAAIQKEFSITFSSDPLNGASLVSNAPNNAGSVFQASLSNPLTIPKEAKSAELTVTAFYGWWTLLNIIYQVNDSFQFTILSGAAQGTYLVKVPAGIYSLPTLANAINLQLLNTYPALAPNPIGFTADESTQRVIIVFNIANCQVDFNIPYTMRNMMGYTGSTSSLQVFVQTSQDIIPDPTLYPAGSFVNQSVYANNVATFNTINYLLVNSPELGRNGIAVNNNNYNTICVAPITVPVGSQIVDEFVKPSVIDVSHIIGYPLTTINFALTDQNGNAVNTNSEVYSINCTFKFTL